MECAGTTGPPTTYSRGRRFPQTTDGGKGGGEPPSGKRKMQGDPDEAKGTFVKHPKSSEALMAKKDEVGKIAPNGFPTGTVAYYCTRG
jgi:hypothetical protein